MTQEFTIPVRVYYEDTDAGGIVYHANYLKFCERARSDFIRTSGIDQQAMLQQGQGFVIASMQAKFKRPARLNDSLTVSCVPIKLRRVGISFLQQVKNAEGSVLFEMECEIAFVNFAQGSPMRLPENITAALKPYLIKEDAQ